MTARKPTVIEAIQALTSQGFGWDGDIGIIWPEKNIGDPPTQVEIDAKWAELLAEWDAQEYARERVSAYPSTGDQLDMMYKDNLNSTTTHKDAVEAVKTKWPKDNSGPVE